jgi:long-chain acyl-CoA synthetase
MAAHTEVQWLLEREIARVNSHVSRAEQVRKFRILPRRLHEEDGEVTPTMKVKRGSICALYADLVESMYE